MLYRVITGSAPILIFLKAKMNGSSKIDVVRGMNCFWQKQVQKA